MEHNSDKFVNMKFSLCLFEQLSRLKINFHKSEFLYFGRTGEEEDHYKQLFSCEVGKLPFRYLGIPIHFRKLTNKEWECIEDVFEKKLNYWKENFTSYGGNLVLINVVVTSLPMFMFSFFEIAKVSGQDWIITCLDFCCKVENINVSAA